MRPLKANEIDARVGTVTAKGVTILLYKNARTDMQILDEEVGTMNWQKDYKEIKGNLYCGIGIWDDDKKQWIWKWDCGTESSAEKEKGEASDAMKRACVNANIGRELYTAPHIFLKVATEPDPYNKGKFKMVNKYELVGLYVSNITYTDGKDARKIKDLDLAMGGMIVWSTDKTREGRRI